ncbi:MAG: preprotein translocase subunit SecE [Bacteroidetes bacterium]|nr:preprotein translocase subunit SecE [Bacteroidota bacterium]
MNKFKAYLESTVDELKNKVSWPTWEELRSSSMLVMVASIIFAFVVMLIDFIGSNLMSIIYNLNS